MAARGVEPPEAVAERLLRRTGFYGLTPVDVRSIAAKLDIRVLEEARLGSQLSGMLVRDESNRALIVVRKRDSPRRQRFTIAHELGHHEMHPGRPLLLEPSGPKFTLNERRTGGEVPSQREETQANRFAAELLMPELLVERHFDQLASVHGKENTLINAMAEVFDVSEVAMEFRLSNLGLLIPR